MCVVCLVEYKRRRIRAEFARPGAKVGRREGHGLEELGKIVDRIVSKIPR